MLQESSVALLEQNTATPACLILELDVHGFEFFHPIPNPVLEGVLILAKEPPSPVAQVLHLPVKEKMELAGHIHSQLGNSPCPPEQSLLQEPEVQK